MLDFPNSPVVGQIFSSQNGTFKWDGVKWVPATAATGGQFGTSQNRNRIINGNFAVDQYNNNAAITPASGNPAYVCDRWQIYFTVASKLTSQCVLSSANALLSSYVTITTASAYTAIASDVFNFAQRIEYQNMSDFAFGSTNAATITLSFWVNASIAGTYSGSLVNSNGSRTYVFPFVVNAANTWQQVSIPVPGDTSGAWSVAANAIGFMLRFDLGSGSSSRTSTTGAWQSANFNGAVGSVALIANAGATLSLSNVQLELGTVATPFDWRGYGDMLALCQRYYQLKSGTFGTYTGQALSAGFIMQPIVMAPAMRAAPTATVTPSGGSGWSSVTVQTTTSTAVVITPAIGSAGPVTFNYAITANAEL